MRKVGRKAFRIVMIMVISLAVGGGFYLWNARTLGGNQMPMPFGVGMAVVLSGSMEPTLHVNDLVVISKAKDYVPDDIVVYQTGSISVIHRLLETDGVTAITKGDANNVADEPIPTYLIKGKMVGRVAGAGAVVKFLRSTPGTMAVILLAAWLLVRSQKKDREDAKSEQDVIRQQIEALKEQMQQEIASAAENGSAAMPVEATEPAEVVETIEAPVEAAVQEERKE